MDKKLVDANIGEEVVINSPIKELTNWNGLNLSEVELSLVHSPRLSIDDCCDRHGDVRIRTKDNKFFFVHHEFLELKGFDGKELKIKSEYVGWKFEPELKNIKKLYVNGKELLFKVIEVEDSYDDGKSFFETKCEDAIVYVPTLCGLNLSIKLTNLIEQSKVFYK